MLFSSIWGNNINWITDKSFTLISAIESGSQLILVQYQAYIVSCLQLALLKQQLAKKRMAHNKAGNKT